MVNYGIDVLCLQEAGNLFKIIEQRYWQVLDNNFFVTEVSIGTRTRFINVCIYYYVWGTADLRCSMAILARKNLDPKDSVIFKPMNGTRSVFGIIVNNNLAVYNIHAPSGVLPHVSGQYVYNTLQEIRYLQQQYAIPNIILTGDFNCSPDILLQSVNPLPYNIYCPMYNGRFIPTQISGNCLDYCITSVVIQAVNVLNDNQAYSDHFQVLFDY